MCRSNTNLEIIKYLIEVQKMSINHANIYNNNCLITGCYENQNLEIIRYLIELSKCAKLDFNHTKKNNDNCLSIGLKNNPMV